MDFTPGRYAIVPGYDGPITPSFICIEQETPKLLKFKRYRDILGQVPKDSVMATVATVAEADRLVNTIAGIRGERDRRIQAARVAANDALVKLLVKEPTA